jgi:hypothetical protein
VKNAKRFLRRSLSSFLGRYQIKNVVYQGYSDHTFVASSEVYSQIVCVKKIFLIAYAEENHAKNGASSGLSGVPFGQLAKKTFQIFGIVSRLSGLGGVLGLINHPEKSARLQQISGPAKKSGARVEIKIGVPQVLFALEKIYAQLYKFWVQFEIIEHQSQKGQISGI